MRVEERREQVAISIRALIRGRSGMLNLFYLLPMSFLTVIHLLFIFTRGLLNGFQWWRFSSWELELHDRQCQERLQWKGWKVNEIENGNRNKVSILGMSYFHIVQSIRCLILSYFVTSPFINYWGTFLLFSFFKSASSCTHRNWNCPT